MDILVYDAAGYAFWIFLCLSDECFVNKVRREKGNVNFRYYFIIAGICWYKIEPHGEIEF